MVQVRAAIWVVNNSSTVGPKVILVSLDRHRGRSLVDGAKESRLTLRLDRGVGRDGVISFVGAGSAGCIISSLIRVVILQVHLVLLSILESVGIAPPTTAMVG